MKTTNIRITITAHKKRGARRGCGHRRLRADQGVLQGGAAAHQARSGCRFDLHLPHCVERVHPGAGADRPCHPHPSRGRVAVYHRHRRRLGQDHGPGQSDRHPSADLHLRRCPPDHHRSDCRSGQGLIDRHEGHHHRRCWHHQHAGHPLRRGG